MKKKNKGKKALTAVGAVVAAGLTPGFIVASAAGSSIQSPNSGITAAEVVAINGQAYSFEELYAKQQPDSVGMDMIETRISALYGVRPIYNIKYDTKDDEHVIYRYVEQMPQFPGGEAALMKYIQSHINYPPMAAENEVGGRVVVRFIVDETGKVSNATVILSADEYLDKEAVRVCKSLPKFTPGRHNGQAVSVWYTLPVTFKLAGEQKATAADTIAIDGKTYGFDELYAKQHPDGVDLDGSLPEVIVQAYPKVLKYGAIYAGSRSYDYEILEGDTVYYQVEKMPKFPIGEAAVKEYIESNIQYPAKALKNRVQGCVIVKYVIEKTGKISNVRVVRSLDKDLDKEAVRLVKTLPFIPTPGRHKGKAVSVWRTQQVVFTLPEE